MGYPLGYNGYKLYYLSTKKFIVSWDVLFFEDKFPFHDPQLDTSIDPFENTVLSKAIPTTSPHEDSINTNHVPVLELNTEAIPTAEAIPSPAPTQVPPQDTVTDAHDLEPTLLRWYARPHNPPIYLQDYAHNVLHPISDHLTYSNLSKFYQTFIFNVNSHYEPKFYHQAVKFPEWRAAMNA